MQMKPVLVFVGVAAAVFTTIDRVPPAVSAERQSQLTCMTLPLDRDKLLAQSLEAYEAECLPELEQRIKVDGTKLTNNFYRLALATIVAHYSAPYGPSDAQSWGTLIKSKTLNCANYGPLTYFLSGEEDLDFVGFDGGAVGNHQQLFHEVDGVSVMLDPTVGLIALTSFDDLLSGKEVKHVFSFFSGDPVVESFNRKVVDAVRHGRYRPSDLLYFYPNAFTNFRRSRAAPFPTPGGVSYRSRQPEPFDPGPPHGYTLN